VAASYGGGPSDGAPPVDAASPPIGIDLDGEDPARDYVKRYVFATKQYGDKTDCILLGKSTERDGKRAVEVRETPKCGKGNAVRDVFYVDVAGDRLTVDDPTTRASLQPWPDGSAPDGPPAQITEYMTLREWRAPLGDELAKLKMSPIRVQIYGRVTYPLITVTGWRAPLSHETKDDELRKAGQELCMTTEGRPFALTSATEIWALLRFKCPEGRYTWERRSAF
jgi:hypothetical protein